MTAPDLRERGLDPAHILSVASQAIARPTARPAPPRGRDGVRVYLSSRLAAGDAAPALTRAAIRSPGSTAPVTGTCWSPAGARGWVPAHRDARRAAPAGWEPGRHRGGGDRAGPPPAAGRPPGGKQDAGRCPHTAAGLGERVLRHSRAPQTPRSGPLTRERAAAGPRAHAGKRDR